MSLTKMKCSTRMDKVIDFNQEILGIKPRSIGLQEAHEAALSYTQMKEEAHEYRDANEQRDYIDTVDAVLDELYFCYGILYKLGLNEQLVDKMFTAIHTANMEKALGKVRGREGFNAADASKPANWVDPKTKIQEILSDHLNQINNY